MSDNMKCLALYPPLAVGSSADEIQEIFAPIPQPKTDEVQVQVFCSTINIDDIHLVEGTMFGGIPLGPKMNGKQAVILGTDVAGVVTAIGDEVSGFKLGDYVFGLHSPHDLSGGWAEFCCVRQAMLLHKPRHWSFTQAAACALGGMVCVTTVENAAPTRKSKCFVIGASGGIGNLITQALVHTGAEVIGVCSTENLASVRAMGAQALDYTAEDFSRSAQNADIVIDCVGGKTIEQQAYKILKKDGHFISLISPHLYLGDEKLAWFEILNIFLHIFAKTVAGYMGKPKYTLAAPNGKHFAGIKKWLIDAKVMPLIDSQVNFNANEVSSAIRLCLSHRAKGKIIIKIKE